MSKLVLLRHGQSVWNREHRFTGWSDVELTRDGVAESESAGEILTEAGHQFDICFTSVLKRGIDSAAATLNTMPDCSPQIERNWRLNERHFDALQGLERGEARRQYGLLRVLRWQRSYDSHPPPLADGDPRFPGNDPLYRELSEKEVPRSESLRDTSARVIPYWQDAIVPHLAAGRSVLIVAHKNSLRVISKRIEGLSDRNATKLQLPTGQPLVYEFDADLNLTYRAFLAPQMRKFRLWTGLSPA